MLPLAWHSLTAQGTLPFLFSRWSPFSRRLSARLPFTPAPTRLANAAIQPILAPIERSPACTILLSPTQPPCLLVRCYILYRLTTVLGKCYCVAIPVLTPEHLILSCPEAGLGRSLPGPILHISPHDPWTLIACGLSPRCTNTGPHTPPCRLLSRAYSLPRSCLLAPAARHCSSQQSLSDTGVPPSAASSPSQRGPGDYSLHPNARALSHLSERCESPMRKYRFNSDFFPRSGHSTIAANRSLPLMNQEFYTTCGAKPGTNTRLAARTRQLCIYASSLFFARFGPHACWPFSVTPTQSPRGLPSNPRD